MLDYLGYLASTIVLISLLMSSVKKLRWINLFGSITFATYGFLIGSIPVGLLNISTALINIYYLYKIYSSKEIFTILPVDQKDAFMNYFLQFHTRDIENFFPTFRKEDLNGAVMFYYARNGVPAGLFIGKESEKEILDIELDYVTPVYRDFKIGDYLYQDQKNLFLNKGYKTLQSVTTNPKHINYLVKMGFKNTKDNVYTLELK